MLRRLMSWCVPDSALRMQTKSNPTLATDPDITSVESVLRPYKDDLEVGGYHTSSIYTVNP